MPLDLRPRRAKHPIELQIHILQQMTRDLDMSHVCRMIQRPDVVVLEDARRVEVVHVARVREVVVDGFDLGEEACALGIGVADGAEARPEGLRVYVLA